MWQFRVPENLQGNTYPSNPCHRNELISGPNSTARNLLFGRGFRRGCHGEDRGLCGGKKGEKEGVDRLWFYCLLSVRFFTTFCPLACWGRNRDFLWASARRQTFSSQRDFSRAPGLFRDYFRSNYFFQTGRFSG